MVLLSLPNLLYGKGADSLRTENIYRKFYFASSLDGGILSTAFISKTQNNITNNSTGTLRFSFILNTGFTYNLNFNKNIGMLTGIDIKNIGFIEKTGDLTTKRRVYTVGVPLAVKLGDMAKKGSYVLIGGGIDVPVNYKEKSFTDRNSKLTKFNEWFSQRTAQVMPYIFAGLKVRRGWNLTLQYYPGNFMNSSYKDVNGVTLYNGYEARIAFFSAGYSLPYGRQKNKKTIGLKGL